MDPMEIADMAALMTDGDLFIVAKSGRFYTDKNSNFP